jgi:putative tryptophan/tyrosine transport system substrate-binding protein
MKKNYFCLALCALLVAFSFSADAQQTKKIPRIGVLYSGSPSSTAAQREAFQQGLRELGYIEGQNITVEYRYSERVAEFPNLATELVRLKVDAIVVASTAGAQHSLRSPTSRFFRRQLMLATQSRCER